MKNKIKEKGFALVEMVVVLGIIGVVTGIVLMSLDTARSQSRDKARISDIKSIQLALETYYIHNKYYPDNLEELVTSGELSKLPLDPVTDNYYLYTSYRPISGSVQSGSVHCRAYHLGALLENNNSLLEDADNFNSINVDSCGYSGTDSAGFNSEKGSLYYDVRSKY